MSESAAAAVRPADSSPQRTALARDRSALAFVAVAASLVRVGSTGGLVRVVLVVAALLAVLVPLGLRRRRVPGDRAGRLRWTAATASATGLVVLVALLP